MYDVVIIGGGIAGLYTAYQLLYFNPTIRLILIEQKSSFFYTGKYDKDYLLLDLMSELGIPLKTYTKDYHGNPESAKKILDIIQEVYYLKHIPTTFKKFALSLMSKQIYEKIRAISEICEDKDIKDTFNDFDDGLAFSTHQIIKKLKKYLSNQIQMDTVKQIKRYFTDSFQIKLSTGIIYSHKVILATDIDTVRRLVPVQRKRYAQIKGKDSVRVYVKCSGMTLYNITIVNGPLRKIYPINIEQGIYMCFPETKVLANTDANCRLFSSLFSDALSMKIEIFSIHSIYCKNDTHYFTPSTENREDFIYHIQHPLKNMFVVGEMTSTIQGWEGDLESVEKIFDEIIPLKPL